MQLGKPRRLGQTLLALYGFTAVSGAQSGQCRFVARDVELMRSSIDITRRLLLDVDGDLRQHHQLDYFGFLTKCTEHER